MEALHVYVIWYDVSGAVSVAVIIVTIVVTPGKTTGAHFPGDIERIA